MEQFKQYGDAEIASRRDRVARCLAARRRQHGLNTIEDARWLATYDVLVKERDEATRKWNAAVYDADKVRTERDRAEREWQAATARAEKAERERDDARAALDAQIATVLAAHLDAPTDDDRKGEDGA